MLAVLTIGGHRYPLGPVRDWSGYLRGLEAALGDDLAMVRAPMAIEVVHRTSRRVVYTVTLEPWPRERESWSPVAAVGVRHA